MSNPQSPNEFVYAGNPNGNVAGNAAGALFTGSPADVCWDTTDGIWWVCTTTGNAAGAVWGKTGTVTTGAGLASVAGSTVTVTASTNAQGQAGTDTTTAMTPASTAAAIATLAPKTPSPGYVSPDLAITTGSNTAFTVTASGVVVTDGAGNYKTIVGVSTTKTTAAFVAGNNNGALDTGAVGASSWYYPWAIAKSDGTYDILISLSSTAPTLPTGYTFSARLPGARRTNASNNLLAVNTIGRESQYVVGGANVSALPQMLSGATGSVTAPTYTSIAVSSFVPPTAKNISIVLFSSAPGSVVIAAPNGSYGSYSNASNPPLLETYGTNQSAYGAFSLESSNIYAASDSAGSSITCSGWEE